MSDLPPPIQRRYHARAKQLKLTVKQGHVTLTIPLRTPEHIIQHFINQATPWLVQQLNKTPEPTDPYPPVIIPSLGLSFNIETHTQRAAAYTIGDVLYKPEQHANKALQQWLIALGKQHLIQRTQFLAAHFGFFYKQCTIKHVVSRWGSCSSHKHINLSAALMLLAQAQIDYIILHELCHTIHMNHSAAFWQEVERVCPDYPQLSQHIKQFKSPHWWLYS